MKYIYHCKHCRTIIDEIEADQETIKKLGLSDLTPEEQAELMAYNQQSQSMYVKTLCDYCYEALKANPELFLIGKPLH
ncbi:anti-sigma-F factor Fin [Desulfuribacillus alkaliarsenatis]|uniref:Peptide ABC transporter permease n=1 Tax=Desulfuribacillus alkaliarsenatis TaxID=766136 RepID=A0A1E5FZU1_9FIRM|nr:anti-sigma-F factor Fin [Desulfuribacillus alkaliarsenatis]OEF95756.1 hypothetical protein BHF68_11705 [Desulfuribacillus alkaliarsenatis]